MSAADKLVPVESFDELRVGMPIVAQCRKGHRHETVLSAANSSPYLDKKGNVKNSDGKERVFQLAVRPECMPSGVPICIAEGAPWKGKLWRFAGEGAEVAS